jgi:hypothetical protein
MRFAAPISNGVNVCAIGYAPQAAADHLGVGLGELQRLKRAGLPHHQMESNNGLCLFLTSEIDQWVRNRQDAPRTPPRDERRPRYQVRGKARLTSTTTTHHDDTTKGSNSMSRYEQIGAQVGDLRSRQVDPTAPNPSRSELDFLFGKAMIDLASAVDALKARVAELGPETA